MSVHDRCRDAWSGRRRDRAVMRQRAKERRRRRSPQGVRSNRYCSHHGAAHDRAFPFRHYSRRPIEFYRFIEFCGACWRSARRRAAGARPARISLVNSLPIRSIDAFSFPYQPATALAIPKSRASPAAGRYRRETSLARPLADHAFKQMFDGARPFAHAPTALVRQELALGQKHLDEIAAVENGRNMGAYQAGKLLSALPGPAAIA